ETRDDAIGEAYDKVARLMGLPYPGGPAIDTLSGEGDPKAFKLPRAVMDNPYDFSFSGVKTACLRAWQKAAAVTDGLSGLQADMAASFQHTVVETLFEKTIRCAGDLGFGTIAVAGGVSANSGLRKRFGEFAEESGVRVYVPKLSFCTDNAAMVAACAYFN